jgi:hypothetical protein
MIVVLSACIAASQIDFDYVGQTLVGHVQVQVGAYPGVKRTVVLDLRSSTSAIAAPPEFYSATSTDDGDYLYLDSKPQFVPTIQTTELSTLSWDILVKRNGVFGVCDDRLYDTMIPRHCKRGRTGARKCDRERCNINYSDQHMGSCVNGSARFTFGLDYVTSVSCEVTKFYNRRTPTVVAGGSSLSLLRKPYNFEYDDATKQMRIWEKVSPIEDLISLAIMAVLAFALAAWLGWTKALNKVVCNPEDDAVLLLWRRLAKVGLIIGDASWLAASVKVYHFVIESSSFMPEALDFLLGEDVAATYCVWYLGIVCGMTLVVLYILLLAMIDSGMRLPNKVVITLESGVQACRTPMGCLAALVVTRWLFEAILLTALHISTPDSLGRSFKDVVGIGIGLAVAAVSGRDAQTLTCLCGSFATRLLIAIALFLILAHVAIFMVYPCVSYSYSQNNASLLLAITVTVQSAAAAALFHKSHRAPRHARERHTEQKKTAKGSLF